MKLMKKRNRWLICITALCFLFGYTTAPLAASTAMIYEGLNMELALGPGVYGLNIGPLNVSKYSKIRVNTWANSGAGTMLVTLFAVDADGVTELGPLDTITIDFSSAATTQFSKTYDVPCKFLKIQMGSLNPCSASLVIFGR